MRNHDVDLRLFRYALASADYGSFRRAAAVLNVQQSTVSRGVRSLENRVGTELFERDHAGIRPTTAGAKFLEEATLGFNHLRRALERAEALQRGEHGELTVGISVPFILMSDLFSRFRKDRAGVSVQILEDTTRGICALLQQRTVDVAFIPKISEGGLARSVHLGDEPMMAVLPKSHPLAGTRKLKLEDIGHEWFILGASGLGPDIEEYLLHRMAPWGTQLRVQLHRVGQCNLINMVALGFGVTIVVGHPPRAATDGIALIPLAGRNVISLHLVWMESNPNPALKALLDIARGPRPPVVGLISVQELMVLAAMRLARRIVAATWRDVAEAIAAYCVPKPSCYDRPERGAGRYLRMGTKIFVAPNIIKALLRADPCGLSSWIGNDGDTGDRRSQLCRKCFTAGVRTRATRLCRWHDTGNDRTRSDSALCGAR